jgi:hypothetical protein
LYQDLRSIAEYFLKDAQLAPLLQFEPVEGSLEFVGCNCFRQVYEAVRSAFRDVRSLALLGWLFYSDKARLFKHSAGVSLHPVTVSLANLPRSDRWTSKGRRLLAYISKTATMDDTIGFFGNFFFISPVHNQLIAWQWSN